MASRLGDVVGPRRELGRAHPFRLGRQPVGLAGPRRQPRAERFGRLAGHADRRVAGVAPAVVGSAVRAATAGWIASLPVCRARRDHPRAKTSYMSQVTSVRPIRNGSTLTAGPSTVAAPPGTGTISNDDRAADRFLVALRRRARGSLCRYSSCAGRARQTRDAMRRDEGEAGHERPIIAPDLDDSASSRPRDSVCFRRQESCGCRAMKTYLSSTQAPSRRTDRSCDCCRSTARPPRRSFSQSR